MEKGDKYEIPVDPILEERSRKTFERISENLHYLANEPSLAFYRLQENTRKTMPRIIERRVDAEKLQRELQGNCYDIEYAIEEIKTMQNTIPTFKRVLELSKMALFLKQQLTYLKAKNLVAAVVKRGEEQLVPKYEENHLNNKILRYPSRRL